MLRRISPQAALNLISQIISDSVKTVQNETEGGLFMLKSGGWMPELRLDQVKLCEPRLWSRYI